MAKKAKTTDSNAPKDKYLKEVANTNEGTAEGPQYEASGNATSAPSEDAAGEQFGSDDTSAPIETPPFSNDQDSFGMSDEGFGAAVWLDNKKITALWSKDETRNSWAAVSGLGWKKLNSSNDTSCTALTILAAHARNYNKNVKLKLDNNQIKELYVW